jgi:hypothetical protein
MNNPETLATRRDNQEWTIQRRWQREGTIKNEQSRDIGNTKGQSRMNNPETLATRRDNQEWTIQRHWQHEGTIKNEQSRDIAILETQDTGRRLTNHKNTKQQRKPKKMINTDPTNTGSEPRCSPMVSSSCLLYSYWPVIVEYEVINYLSGFLCTWCIEHMCIIYQLISSSFLIHRVSNLYYKYYKYCLKKYTALVSLMESQSRHYKYSCNLNIDFDLFLRFCDLILKLFRQFSILLFYCRFITL